MLSFLTNKPKCSHDRVYPLASGSFCPDCGYQIKIFWQILRCDCCSSKRKAFFSRSRLIPVEKFCTKCGSSEFYIEKKEKVQFFDYEYAVILKEEVKEKNFKDTIQIWIEEESRGVFVKPMLLTVN